MSKQPKIHLPANLPANLWAKLPKLAQELFVAMQTHIEELEARVKELEVLLEIAKSPISKRTSFQCTGSRSLGALPNRHLIAIRREFV